MVNRLEIPRAGEGKRGESGYLGYLLRQAAGAHRLRMERALAEIDMTVPQFLVLTMLKAYEGASGADIARLSQLTPQTVSVIIANLEKSALVERVPDPVHGRIQRLSPTAKGLDLMACAKRMTGALEVELAQGFSDQEMAIVRRWLAAIAKPGNDG